jgi:mevalonate kinase
MKKEFYSNGKLLITGEYLVLDGAKAFALPTKYGQNLIVEENTSQIINWISYDSDGSVWYQDVFTFDAIYLHDNSEKESSIRNTLLVILREAFKLNEKIIDSNKGYNIATALTFQRNWGLGTSSTLINNIAQWLQIDAFVLLKNSFGGSGYDIASAQNNSPILYHIHQEKPIVEKVNFEPAFAENLYFVYLEEKQSSKESIASYYNNKNRELTQSIINNDILTNKVLESKSLSEFALALEEHEAAMSLILEMETIKESTFPDFEGVVKSLGAWGGDFVLAISKENPTEYFIKNGYKTIIPYKEMIL